MESSLSALIDLYVFSTGRRLFALGQVIRLAKEQSFPELAKHCSGAITHDRECLSLERRWAGVAAASKAKAPPANPADPSALGLVQIDGLVDNALTAIRDHAVSQTAGALPGDPIHATVAGFLKEIFPGGLQQVTGLAFVLELAAVDDILALLRGKDLAPVVKDLGLGRLVARLGDLNELYRAALRAPEPETIEFGKVRAARTAGQDLLLEAVAIILGKHHGSSPEDVAARADLLKPILDQNDQIAAALRGKRSVVDVNPETGQLDPKAPTEAPQGDQPAKEPSGGG